MKNNIPSVDDAVWQSLYFAMLTFEKATPWEVLGESLFAVESPDQQQMGYGAVMGRLGEVFGLCLYRDRRGLDIYRRLESGELDATSADVIGAQMRWSPPLWKRRSSNGRIGKY